MATDSLTPAERGALTMRLQSVGAEATEQGSAPTPKKARAQRGRGRPGGSGWIERDETLRGFLISIAVERGFWLDRRIAALHHLPTRARRITIAQIVRLAAKIFPQLTVSKKIEKAVARFLTAYFVAHMPEICAMQSAEKFEGRFSWAVGSQRAGLTRFNELVQIDGRRANFTLADGSRPLELVLYDTFTGTVLIHHARSETAHEARAAYRKWCIKYGPPERLRFDRGVAFLADAFSGEPMQWLGTKPQPAPRPYFPRFRGGVERTNRTRALDYDQVHPLFSGHSIAMAQELRERDPRGTRAKRLRMRTENLGRSIEEEQQRADTWAAEHNARSHPEVSELTRDQVREKFPGLRGPLAPAQCAFLLCEVPRGGSQRFINKKGIRVAGRDFFPLEADDIDAFTKHAISGARSVHVFYDPQRPEAVHLYTNAGGRLCTGVDLTALDAPSRRALALHATAAEKKFVADFKTVVRRSRRRITTDRALRLHFDGGTSGDLAAVIEREAGEELIARARPALIRPPLEHADRAEVDAQFAAIAPRLAARANPYDESAEIAATVARWQQLHAMPRAQWSKDDLQFEELAAPLPEVRALHRRAAAS